MIDFFSWLRLWLVLFLVGLYGCVIEFWPLQVCVLCCVAVTACTCVAPATATRAGRARSVASPTTSARCPTATATETASRASVAVSRASREPTALKVGAALL